MRVAYLINQYPKVSHTFIRREILALERRGVEVMRIALRGWDGELVDAEDETRAQAHALRPARGRAGAAAGRPAHAAHAAGAADAGAGAGLAHEPRRGAAAARAPRLPGRGLPHRAVAARRRHPARARALRHQLGRGGDAGACARRAALELHRARAGGVRQGAADRPRGEGAARARSWWRSAPTAAASSTAWCRTSTGPR